jgi:hypothetical protein
VEFKWVENTLLHVLLELKKKGRMDMTCSTQSENMKYMQYAMYTIGTGGCFPGDKIAGA